MTWDKHLAYEIRQLCSDLDLLYEIWPAMHGATPSDPVEGVAYFEASLVHARNLIEFLVRGPVDLTRPTLGLSATTTALRPTASKPRPVNK